MGTRRYRVFVDGKAIAQAMPLEYAIVLIRAIFEEYYNDHNMEVMIKEMPQEVDEDEIWERNTTM